MKTCDTCKHYNRILVPCYGCINMRAWEPKPQTRADRIRAKSDEELATWVETIAGCDLCPMLDEQCSGGEVNSRASCKLHWLEWLRQEAEEGAGTT